jgi:Family of unknown function (DUF5681)
MTFQPGQSGNPAGRALGSRNKKTLAVEAALFEHAQELVDDLVARAKNGEPAAMRLALERILPVGRGRPLPIELPPVRTAEDAHAAAGVIMDALKHGAISAAEAVDLLRVVEGLTRLTGAIEFIKKVARREVVRAAQTLGVEHFLGGRPAADDYARRVAEANEDDAPPALDAPRDAVPGQTRSPDGAMDRGPAVASGPRISAAPLRSAPCCGAFGARPADVAAPRGPHPGNASGLQIVADSEATAARPGDG